MHPPRLIVRMKTRVARSSAGLIALGSIAGALAAAVVAPWLKPLFHPPTGGVGLVTIAHYPKGWDYAVVAILITGSFLGGLLASLIATRKERAELAPPVVADRAHGWWVVAVTLVVFVAMAAVHDHPYSLMEPFHEGENLTPAFELRAGLQPWGDVFFLHGLAFDGGLASLVIGDPPQPIRTRRLTTLLNAATLALLVPLAAEVGTTIPGVAIAAFLSLCVLGAGMVPVFPYDRLAPVILAALGLVRYARRGTSGALLLAFSASTLGLLWSLDTGMYALMGTVGVLILLRLFDLEAKPASWKRIVVLAAIAVALFLGVVFAVHGDLKQFFVDSFLIIPDANNASGSLPAPKPPGFAILTHPAALYAWLVSETARYYIPPVFYGFLAVLALQAWARDDRAAASRLVVIAILSMLLFRSAAGRCGWSHKRFGLPLLGVAIVAFVFEPLFWSYGRTMLRRVAYLIVAIALAIPLWSYLEVAKNTADAAKFIEEWPSRQSPAKNLVPYPVAAGGSLYTSPQNAADLAALDRFVNSRFPASATIFDFSNERALYYLLHRLPATRCLDIMTISAPRLEAETLRELNAHPPACVIVKGYDQLYRFDNIPNDVRTPKIAAWIDAHFPKRTKVGRFIVATK